MKTRMRQIESEEDFWRIRSFLREVTLANNLREHSWHVARWDYWRWHGIENCGADPLMDSVFLWETAKGEIAAVVNPENRNSIYFQVHPKYRSPALEQEMLKVAENHLAYPNAENKKQLHVFATENDELREKLLEQNGYTLGTGVETQNRRLVSRKIPDVSIPDGFTIRSLGDQSELPARSWASFRGFHPNDPPEKYSGWEWYLNIQRCPLYRRDLDIVAVAPNTEIASFCTIWYDDVTRSAYYEPVATPPEYQRKGLAKACMMEGLRRLQKLGCELAFVGSEAPHAQAFYHSIGFDEHDLFREWTKEF